MDLGARVSYEVLEPGTPIYSSDGEQIGKVAHVLADEGEDVFDGVVIGEHVFGTEHRFADADEIEDIYEHGLVLKGGVQRRSPAREADARLGLDLGQLLILSDRERAPW